MKTNANTTDKKELKLHQSIYSNRKLKETYSPLDEFMDKKTSIKDANVKHYEDLNSDQQEFINKIKIYDPEDIYDVTKDFKTGYIVEFDSTPKEKVFAVRDIYNGGLVIIDSQGYDYARYIVKVMNIPDSILKEEFLDPKDQEKIDNEKNKLDSRAGLDYKTEEFLTADEQLNIDTERDDLNNRANLDYEVEDDNNETQMDKEVLYGMKEHLIKLYTEVKKIIKSKTKLRENEKFHRDSALQLADQMSKYIAKHQGNVNSVVNDISIGLFMGLLTYYKNDGNTETSGSDILKKVMKKLTAILTEFPELETGDLKNDFNLDGQEIEDAGKLTDEDIVLEQEEPEDELSYYEQNEDSQVKDEDELEEDSMTMTGGMMTSIRSNLPQDMSPYRPNMKKPDSQKVVNTKGSATENVDDQLIEGEISDYEIDWWKERDRASIVVSDRSGETIWECWDSDCQELIEDGFIKWDDDKSVINYLKALKIIK